jgi:hypothetical protein
MRTRDVAWIGWVALTLWASGHALAEDAAVGSVLAMHGEAFVESDGSLQPLINDAPVHVGDAILTDKGKAKIALHDGSVISVGEHARLWIRRYDSRNGNVKARLSLVSGAMQLRIAKVGPDGNFEVESETAVAAVRGTEWVMEATPGQTSVALLDGSVAVSSRQLQTAVVLRTSGEGTDVRRGSPPAPPVAWDAHRLADVLARATFE